MVDDAEVLWLRQPHERAGRVVGPGVERAREPTRHAAFGRLDKGAAVAARVDERLERTVGSASGEDRDAEVVVGEECAGFGKVLRQADALGAGEEELVPLALGDRTVDIRRGGHHPHPTGVDGGAGVEVGAELLDQPDLFVVTHSWSQL